MQHTVGHILDRKNKPLATAAPDALVMDALAIMADRNIGSLIIMSDTEDYLGLLTERDYARKIILMKRSSRTTPVSDIMSTDLPRVSRSHTVDSCMELMSEHNVRYLPVFDGQKFIGLISITDLVSETILAQKETIKHLNSYISGNY